ncbi:hypothetical protein J0A68_08960 [Algoriphagus sp. H41]|uniref:Uncharacterized protein n=1 Tax=Algoriphagus oliviformis TaxID=2811231 RepID=A0ABS3C1U6_9BACT|nr:hypothetical protein [Algoriphagus oliviformis]MBN7811084.1 hypothetical protein [Algoriphagus oliviformis]
MKQFLSLFALFIGTSWAAYGQERPAPDFSYEKPFTLPFSKFAQPEQIQKFSPKVTLADAGKLLAFQGPRIEREIHIPAPTPFTSRMPLLHLPDPETRMPIRDFDDSVNYTILKKDY